MNRRISLLLVLLFLLSFLGGQAMALSPQEESRVLYADFLQRYSAFVQEAVSSKTAAKGSLKKEKKDGMRPFSIKGEEGTLEGLLVKASGAENAAAPEGDGWVDSFTITLKYPGNVYPVLGAIHALAGEAQAKGQDIKAKIEEAYMMCNPDAQGTFHIPNFTVQTLDKTKDGLAKKISFSFTPGSMQGAPDAGTTAPVPVDLDGFVNRWRFETLTSSANVQTSRYIVSIKPKVPKLKTGKADEQGQAPFTMVTDNGRIKVEVNGMLLDGIVQSVTVRYIPAKAAYATNPNYIRTDVKRALYALSGAVTGSGLMPYRDLRIIAGQHGDLLKPFAFADSLYGGMIEFEFQEMKTILESKPFNGYQVSISNVEENGINVRQFDFKLIKP